MEAHPPSVDPSSQDSFLRRALLGRDADDRKARHEYRQYMAQQMGPMVHALMLVAVAAYLVAACVSALVSASSLPFVLRMAPVLPLLAVAMITRRVRSPLTLSLVTLSCVLLLEIGINLNGLGRAQGLLWVLPGGLLIPVTSSVIWPGRWDFLAAMTLCALGPLPMILLGDDGNGMRIIQYSVYMAVAIGLSAVLRAFMTRTLHAQFRLERQLREQANTDGLTGLLLRNRFLELAQEKLASAQLPTCMLYLDADHFKRLNDDHGHAAGDDALMAMAAALRAQTRPNDLIGRIGGEEFALLLPGLDMRQAAERAERLRLAIHSVRRPDGPLTVSIGIAQCSYPGESIGSLLARADQAMRQAKRNGRDRVVKVVA
jgi:diguanylate cyclase (GGDEF)-like protein